jgi:pimeloyl-ACP methyl ester carboxylesterase
MTWMRAHIEGSLLDQADYDQRAIISLMRMVTLKDGSTLRVLDIGEGEPILLLPMIAELNFVYAPQIEEFQDDYRVILYEPRLSAKERVGVADRVREALALLSHLGIDDTHIIVWGDTGAAAYQLAKYFPNRCRSLVFIGLADRYKFPQPYQFLLQLLRYLPIEFLVSPPAFAAILGKFVGGTQVKPEWMVQRTTQVPDITRLFKQSILPNLIEHNPKAGEVNVKSLVIGGDRDRVVSVSQAHRMATLLSNVHSVVILPGGEHFVSYVDAPTVNKVIREFYASLA